MLHKTCPICGNDLKRDIRKMIYSYKGHSVTVSQPGLYCDKCGESILNGNDLKATRKAIHDMQCSADGLLSSDEVRRIRTKVKMTQKDAGEIFGGGINAFSRYERGEIKQSRSIDLLLRLIDRNIEELKEISPEHYRLATKSTRQSHLRLVWEGKKSFSVSSDSRGGSKPVGRTRKIRYKRDFKAEVRYG